MVRGTSRYRNRAHPHRLDAKHTIIEACGQYVRYFLKPARYGMGSLSLLRSKTGNAQTAPLTFYILLCSIQIHPNIVTFTLNDFLLGRFKNRLTHRIYIFRMLHLRGEHIVLSFCSKNGTLYLFYNYINRRIIKGSVFLQL